MAKNTGIGWTRIIGSEGATWNPIRAINRETGKEGYFCVKVSDGCKFCYAETMNMTSPYVGNKLEYKVTNLPNVQLIMSGISDNAHGQTAIDWPLRAKKSVGIFPCSMTDWLGEFVPEQWSAVMLATMGLAQHHVFLPLTKRYERLLGILNYYTLSGKEIWVPQGKTWDQAIRKAAQNSPNWQGGIHKLNVTNGDMSVMLPWPPPNVIFGVTIVNQKEADEVQPILAKIKQLAPGLRTWVSYEPALQVIDWQPFDHLIDWLVVGGESGPNARPMSMDALAGAIGAGKAYQIPVYVKQAGSVLARELGLKDKGVDMPEPFAIHQFPDVTKSYIPWR